MYESQTAVFTRAVGARARLAAGRQHADDDLPRPVSRLRRAGRGVPRLGRRRRRAHRLHLELHVAHPRPLPSAGRRGGAGAGRAADERRGAERAGDRARRADSRASAERRAGPLHELRHGGDDARAARGAGLHRPGEDRRLRGRLPRVTRLRGEHSGRRLRRSGRAGHPGRVSPTRSSSRRSTTARARWRRSSRTSASSRQSSSSRCSVRAASCPRLRASSRSSAT